MSQTRRLASARFHWGTWEAVSFQQKFRHLTLNQITELSRHGFEIGSHGKMHRYLPALTNQALTEELEGSKENLEKLTGQAIISFCYPYGRCNGRVINAVKNAGYQYATCNYLFKSNGFNNPLTLKRRSIYSIDSITDFKEKVFNHSIFAKSYFSEFIIQQGALAGIGVQMIRDRLSF